MVQGIMFHHHNKEKCKKAEEYFWQKGKNQESISRHEAIELLCGITFCKFWHLQTRRELLSPFLFPLDSSTANPRCHTTLHWHALDLPCPRTDTSSPPLLQPRPTLWTPLKKQRKKIHLRKLINNKKKRENIPGPRRPSSSWLNRLKAFARPSSCDVSS